MKRFISYGSIKQYRNIVKDMSAFGNPKLIAEGTEKIHGTNASVCFSNPDGFWVQSRNNIIIPEKDNAGCAFDAYQKEPEWLGILLSLASDHNIDLDKNIISVYYEWCGGSIQKNSAVSGLEKRAIIFKHFKVSPIEPSEDEPSIWLNTNGRKCKDKSIYNITDFPKVEVEIDFSNPRLAQNTMIDLVAKLEPSSLVGEQFGIKDNIGEGYVFTVEIEGQVKKFKVKGEKHAGKSKVKTLKVVDEAFENEKIEFVNSVCTQGRLNQAWQELFGLNNEKQDPDLKSIGFFLKLVISDIIKEESDLMAKKGLEPKCLNGKISKVSVQWFKDKFNEL